MAFECTPVNGRRRAGRPKRTWMNEDLEIMGLDWSDVREAIRDHARWKQIVARCSAWNRLLHSHK